jgi:nitrate/TMAO reductase-like tetraheme cytochrome c subunit
MSGLDKHFGSNASLDAESANEITAFLEKNAGRKGREPSGKPTLRITDTSWFKSEHREVAARDWKNPKVKSPANCAACHTKAETGDFNERNVRIPK